MADPDPYRDPARILNELTRNIGRLHVALHTALRNLALEANQHDSLPTTASGRVRETPNGNAELTRVEAAAHHRLTGPTLTAWDIYDQLVCARDASNHALRIAEQHCSLRLTDAEKSHLRCIANTVGTRCTELAALNGNGSPVDGLCPTHQLAQRATIRAQQSRIRYHTARRKSR